MENLIRIKEKPTDQMDEKDRATMMSIASTAGASVRQTSNDDPSMMTQAAKIQSASCAGSCAGYSLVTSHHQQPLSFGRPAPLSFSGLPTAESDDSFVQVSSANLLYNPSTAGASTLVAIFFLFLFLLSPLFVGPAIWHKSTYYRRHQGIVRLDVTTRVAMERRRDRKHPARVTTATRRRQTDASRASVS
jgi:hypothetical protein